MHLQWICICILGSCWIRPTEGMFGSWDLSSLLNSMIHGNHDTEPETFIERSLSRRKRAAGPSEYTMDIEITFPDPSFVDQIRQFVAMNLSFPIQVVPNDTEITSINITSVCSQTGSNVQCSCESGYTWPAAVCSSYTTCSGSNASSCSCITGTSVPTQYCQAQPVSINLSLKILENFTPDFANPTSTKYIEYKGKIETQLTSAYQSLPGFRSVTVTGFRPGSIVADYTVVTEPVSPAAISTANTNAITNLAAANLTVAPVIKTTKTDQSTITVSPSSIFLNDTVVLTCTVSISSFTGATWYFNNLALPTTSYTTSVSGSTVQSRLTLSSIKLNNAGTYKCIVEDSSYYYQTNQTIVVQPLVTKVMNTGISCFNTEIPVIQCCTEGPSMDFALTCSTGAISGIARNNTPCKTYQVAADQANCDRLKAGDYSCTCSTPNGASETSNVRVTYQATYVTTVTTATPTISERSNLNLQCKCNATNVQAISWNFGNTPIQVAGVTMSVSLPNCQSTLTIPGNLLTVAWSGTYQCLVDTGNSGTVSGSTQITIANLISPSQINANPLLYNFKCNNNIMFSCCIGSTTEYSKADLQITTPGSSFTQAMAITRTCFTYTYTPTGSQCVNFKAACIITNRIGDTVTSDNMQLTFVADPKCTTPYFGDIGSLITVSCKKDDNDTTVTGTKNLTCVASGNSGTWVDAGSNCVSAQLANIQNTLVSLTSPTTQETVPAVLQTLSTTVSSIQETVKTSGNDIKLVVNILQAVDDKITAVPKSAMVDFLQTVDVVVANTTTWNNVPNKVDTSSNLLKSVESFAEKLTITGPIEIKNNSNVQLKGNIVSSLEEDYKASFNFSQTNNLTGNVLIGKGKLDTLPNTTTVVSVAYATLKEILGNAGNATSHLGGVINTLVITTTVKNYSTGIDINMDFRKNNQSLNNATCVFWNFTLKDWDSSGCQQVQNNDSTKVSCYCDHLTPFSVLMSSDTLPPSPDVIAILTYISYIGLGISMLSLVICIIIEATIWKSVTKNKTSYMRHLCIMNIAVTLLLADIWFIIGDAMSESKKVDACVAATFFTHLFYLCTFFWMLTMGLILFYRLMCVFHDLSKTVMMGISFFLGYGCPIIISVITVAVTKPRNIYTNNNACWLNVTESRAFLAFIVPALTILLVNFITLFVVLIKVLRPSVGDKPKKEEKSTLNHITKCILILTPLLGLTWGFGIGTLFSSSPVIHGIFSALNALQGLFILLFGTLLDKKVRDALLSKFSVSRWASQQTKSTNLSSSDPVFAKGGFNLFAKKGVYNISSAQTNSSSEMSNSYSLLT
ncbi:adhesion G protein-coupled receptor F5-like isoform X2 [Dendropsophus ebraccatus]